MESEPAEPEDRTDDVDPQGLLNLLGDARASATSESLWPPNPLWHGPLLAAVIWGLLAFAWEQTTPAGILGLAAASVGIYVTGFQYMRQRKVRGVRPTGAVRRRLIVMHAFTGLMSLLVIAGWGQTVYRFGGSRPGLIPIVIGLAVSSAVLTLGVSITNALARHWLVPAR